MCGLEVARSIHADCLEVMLKNSELVKYTVHTTTNFIFSSQFPHHAITFKDAMTIQVWKPLCSVA